MRLRSPLRGPFRRKVFRVRLGPGILRLGGSDPPPPPWGGARRARLPAQDSTLSWPIRSLHKLSQLPRPAVSSPPPVPPPPASSAWPGAGAQGEARAGSRAVSCGSRLEPTAARVYQARGVAAPRSHPHWAPALSVGRSGMGSRRGLGQPRAGLCLLLISLQLLPQTQAGELGGRYWTQRAGCSEIPKDCVVSGRA